MSVVTPRARSLPALMCAAEVLTWSNIIATCPPITSTSDCALPLYGTCSMRIPALRMNISPATWPVEPFPEVA